MSNSILTTNKQILSLLNKSEFSKAAELLLQIQMNEWDKLKDGYANLSSTKTKTFIYDGFEINTQFNEQRIHSTSANVDEYSIKNRKCFLCEKNLPEKQEGFKLSGDYLLLCNPYPVFPEHFTIVSAKHKPQEILFSFGDFINLTKLLSDNYTLIYNGSQCGASAPDHLHFQAGTKYFMPIENDFQSMKKEYGVIIYENEEITLTASNDGLRRIIGLESSNDKALIKLFGKVYSALPNVNGEPMMNIICNYDKDNGWRMIIFLRSKHRPSYYYFKGEEQIIFSPAAIDLGGVCILPVKKDYNKIDKDLLISIFNEVNISVDDYEILKGKLKGINFNDNTY